MNYIDRLSESLFGKLAVIFGLLILSGSGIFWYISSQADKRDLMDNSVAFISSFSEVIHRSIKHSMLLNNRSNIRMTLESIGAAESIKRVSLVNRNGIIHYSSEKRLIGNHVDKTFLACAGCHHNAPQPRGTLLKSEQWTIYSEVPGHRILSYIEPIYNEPDCYTSECHAHSRDQRVLGVLVTDFSLDPIDKRIHEKMINTLLFTLLFFTVSAVLLYLIFWRFIISPITVLSGGMERVSSGDLSQTAPYPAKDEIGRLARTFNSMLEELRISRRKMETWTQTLEAEVEKKTIEIRKTQGKLIQSEKMAALGRLTADIAHEIRNPLTALGGFGRKLQRIAVGNKEKEYSDIIVSEVDRLEHILRDVLSFSREAKFHFERIPVTDIVAEAVASFAEVCVEHSLTLVTRYNSDLPILAAKLQAGKALENLISNAIDAMPKGGTLTVVTGAEELNDITYVAVHVSDTGPGIPEIQLPLIFEPFHTTKMVGYGTGLGLSIARKIIEEHGGFIRATNNPEAGITFSIYFPYQSSEDLAKAPCWTFMQCKRDINSEMKCPAYPHFGRVCWVVAGTFCEGKVQGTFAQKYENCTKCDFYKKATKNEI